MAAAPLPIRRAPGPVPPEAAPGRHVGQPWPATRQTWPASHCVRGFQIRGVSSSRSAINRRVASMTWLQNSAGGMSVCSAGRPAARMSPWTTPGALRRCSGEPSRAGFGGPCHKSGPPLSEVVPLEPAPMPASAGPLRCFRPVVRDNADHPHSGTIA
jgi:hypothetical protein